MTDGVVLDVTDGVGDGVNVGVGVTDGVVLDVTDGVGVGVGDTESVRVINILSELKND